MSDNKYFGLWSERADVIRDFEEPEASFPPDEAIILASYEYRDYSGDAFVVYELDGKLFEVNGGHCSCSGLEGQWSPEETTWEAVAMRFRDGGHFGCGDEAFSPEVRERLKALLDERLPGWREKVGVAA